MNSNAVNHRPFSCVVPSLPAAPAGATDRQQPGPVVPATAYETPWGFKGGQRGDVSPRSTASGSGRVPTPSTTPTAAPDREGSRKVTGIVTRHFTAKLALHSDSVGEGTTQGFTAKHGNISEAIFTNNNRQLKCRTKFGGEMWKSHSSAT